MGTEGSNGLTTLYQNDSFPRLLQHANSLDFLHSNRTKQPAVCKPSASSQSDHRRSGGLFCSVRGVADSRESPQVRF